MEKRVNAHLLSPIERPDALRRLARAARANLFLLDLVEQLGRGREAGEIAAQVLGAWQLRDGRSRASLVGLLAVRPSLVLDAEIEPSVLPAFEPYLQAISSGLVKSRERIVTPFWRQLQALGRRAIVDRIETAWLLEPDRLVAAAAPAGARLRPAQPGDLAALVEAARASLREEHRPDPFDGDPSGFRRWVAGRLPRARVAEWAGQVVFVAYADVRRSEGWLVQGVYTWPAWRRRGLAAAGMSELAREAFAAGADHLQLAVVEGNRAAEALYRGLGFEPFDTLRTVLFGGSRA